MLGIGGGLAGASLGLCLGILVGACVALPLFAILITVLGEATHIPGQTTPWDDYRFAIQLFVPAIVWGLCALGGAVWAFIVCYKDGV
jgi:hypothetical protein